VVALIGASWVFHAIAQTLATAQPDLIPYAIVTLLGGQTALAWVWICLVARRLHDIGRSGWWQAVPLALVAGCVAAAEPAWAADLGLDPQAAVALVFVAVAINLAYIAAIGAVPGQGPNRFGPAAEG
jgi:uncharacterized membrane protein YhaH (DUF805 family)